MLYQIALRPQIREDHRNHERGCSGSAANAPSSCARLHDASMPARARTADRRSVSGGRRSGGTSSVSASSRSMSRARMTGV